MIKIGTTKGYTVLYDERRKLFVLQDAEGNELTSGATQDEVEAKAGKLSQLAFKLPILALKVSGFNLEKGRVTSVNPDERSAYFVYDNKKYGSHAKLHLPSDAYELTEANSQIYEQMQQCHSQIVLFQERIQSLIGQLEKRMDLDYFGLKSKPW